MFKIITQSVGAARAVPQALKLLWAASPRLLALTLVATVLQGIVPAGIALTTKLIIDHITLGQGWNSTILVLLIVEGCLSLMLVILVNLATYSSRALRERTQTMLALRVMNQAATLDLEFFEMPGNYDSFARAKRELSYRPIVMAVALFNIVQSLATVAGFLIVLLSLQPILVLITVCATLPIFFVGQATGFVNYTAYNLMTPEGRRAAYFEKLLTEDVSAKEIRLYNLAYKFLNQAKHYLDTIANAHINVEGRRALSYGVAQTISVLVLYVVIGFVLYRATNGMMSIGDLVFVLTALLAIRQQLSEALATSSELLENSMFFGDLAVFFKHRPSITPTVEPHTIPSPITYGLTIENLTFSYPNAETHVFNGLSLDLRVGEATALVGVNGAGKTTLVKLLARLYDPNNGRILLDGIDIRQFDPTKYRAVLGIITQDFVRYQLSAEENVYLGCEERDVDESLLEKVAEQAQLSDLIRSLPDGWKTLLGRQFHVRGQDLSGGQWQRIALARALYRDAPILILDEPTAALDAEAEHELFKQYKNLTRNKLSLLITHRFNTVKMADRIIVLENGKVAEDGTHDELMHIRGRYFSMFTSQAEAYVTQN